MRTFGVMAVVSLLSASPSRPAPPVPPFFPPSLPPPAPPAPSSALCSCFATCRGGKAIACESRVALNSTRRCVSYDTVRNRTEPTSSAAHNFAHVSHAEAEACPPASHTLSLVRSRNGSGRLSRGLGGRLDGQGGRSQGRGPGTRTHRAREGRSEAGDGKRSVRRLLLRRVWGKEFDSRGRLLLREFHPRL